jgi:hypothetical protein
MKATPLKRRVPLRARHGSGPGAVGLAVVRLVCERDGYLCACCGRSVIGQPHTAGYRKLPHAGGTGDPPNMLTFLGVGINPLDPDDHYARIRSRREPEDAARGYCLRPGDDPELVPVVVMSAGGTGVTVWLTRDGRLSFDPPPGA